MDDRIIKMKGTIMNRPNFGLGEEEKNVYATSYGWIHLKKNGTWELLASAKNLTQNNPTQIEMSAVSKTSVEKVSLNQLEAELSVVRRAIAEIDKRIAKELQKDKGDLA